MMKSIINQSLNSIMASPTGLPATVIAVAHLGELVDEEHGARANCDGANEPGAAIKKMIHGNAP
jgi:hypothetical protein